MPTSPPIRKAVIPAAGMGTRFLPATKAMPKEMLPVVDKPTIQYVVEEAVTAGLDDILLITSHSKRAIEDHFDRAHELEEVLAAKGDVTGLELIRKSSELAAVHYTRQGSPKGLGHAVLCGAEHVGNEPFAVLLGDDIVDAEEPCIGQMMRIYEKRGNPVIALQEVPRSETRHYGIVAGIPVVAW